VSVATILDEILEHKRDEVEEARREVPLFELERRIADASPTRDFAGMLRGPQVRIIAEIKRASPSEGEIMPGEFFDPRIIAQEYAGNGAAAISVLTDARYFMGEPQFVKRARGYQILPILRKDFIVDEYQIHESRALLADAILLIVAALNDAQIRRYLKVARDLAMSVLVEAHDAEEVRRAVDSGARVIGINNRNLKTMTTEIGTTLALAELVPGDRILVTESGIKTRNDVERLAQCGIDAALVGTSLMKTGDPGRALKPLTTVDSQRGARRDK
jgi:indole-3-glycerol phosphate synthase